MRTRSRSFVSLPLPRCTLEDQMDRRKIWEWERSRDYQSTTPEDGVLTKVLYAGDDMTERRKSYLAMRQLIAARELKELRSERE